MNERLQNTLAVYNPVEESWSDIPFVDVRKGWLISVTHATEGKPGYYAITAEDAYYETESDSYNVQHTGVWYDNEEEAVAAYNVWLNDNAFVVGGMICT
ncbi:hypothetical protein [Achromobacter phage Motura]|uniref:Uncharacterized protein n=1 Tax=Achromobacter phage Motura TaxID=2591403 RepID=A0A514CSE9_9CAUD|nr:hypothetical protein H1O15_gp061 [Achromobacter phage Motura]QDH83401.1 hypothetical protein [Achromobacter phage Motura]